MMEVTAPPRLRGPSPSPAPALVAAAEAAAKARAAQPHQEELSAGPSEALRRVVELLQACSLQGGLPEESLPEVWWDIPDAALARGVEELLAHIDTLNVECGRLFWSCEAVNSMDGRMPVTQVYEVTQRLIFCFGCAEPEVLERIAAIFVASTHGCEEEGLKDVDFPGHVAAVLTQILRELQAKARLTATASPYRRAEAEAEVEVGAADRANPPIRRVSISDPPVADWLPPGPSGPGSGPAQAPAQASAQAPAMAPDTGGGGAPPWDWPSPAAPPDLTPGLEAAALEAEEEGPGEASELWGVGDGEAASAYDSAYDGGATYREPPDQGTWRSWLINSFLSRVDALADRFDSAFAPPLDLEDKAGQAKAAQLPLEAEVPQAGEAAECGAAAAAAAAEAAAAAAAVSATDEARGPRVPRDPRDPADPVQPQPLFRAAAGDETSASEMLSFRPAPDEDALGWGTAQQGLEAETGAGPPMSLEEAQLPMQTTQMAGAGAEAAGLPLQQQPQLQQQLQQQQLLLLQQQQQQQQLQAQVAAYHYQHTQQAQAAVTPEGAAYYIQGQGGGIRGYTTEEAMELLEQEGMPAYVALGHEWAPRLLLLDRGRYIYFIEEMNSNDPSGLIADSPFFSLAELQQITRFSYTPPAAPGRHRHRQTLVHALRLDFEEGCLTLRFSFPELLLGLIKAVISERRVPVIEARA